MTCAVPFFSSGEFKIARRPTDIRRDIFTMLSVLMSTRKKTFSSYGRLKVVSIHSDGRLPATCSKDVDMIAKRIELAFRNAQT